MDDKTKRALLLAGLGISLSASAALAYFLFKPDGGDEEFAHNILGKAKGSLTSSTSRQTVIRLKIPNDMVGVIVGRKGATIKDLQDKTSTRIRFEDKEEGHLGDRVLVIRGSPENAQEAETIIHNIINEQPEIITEEIFIPVRTCGRIIGRNGDNIRHMCHTSKAKINVERGGDERDPDNMRLVTIRGTREQIEMAISMIDEKLAEEETFRQRVNLSSAGRTRFQQRLALGFDSGQTLNANSHDGYLQECLTEQSPDGFSEVFISSVVNPSKFWVQVVGTKSIDLDKLVDDMSDFYNHQPNRDSSTVEVDVKVGDLVAAPFEKDVCWYRARVEKVITEEYSPSNVQLEIYYVDFGEMATFNRQAVCHLKPEFKSLPFQAIECRLANVKPESGIWMREATDLFEKLTYAAQWKVIMAKPVSNPLTNENEKKVTYVELIDTNCEFDIPIAKELVKNKFAVWDIAEIK